MKILIDMLYRKSESGFFASIDMCPFHLNINFFACDVSQYLYNYSGSKQKVGVTIADILTIAIVLQQVTWILRYYCDSVGIIVTVLRQFSGMSYLLDALHFKKYLKVVVNTGTEEHNRWCNYIGGSNIKMLKMLGSVGGLF